VDDERHAPADIDDGTGPRRAAPERIVLTDQNRS